MFIPVADISDNLFRFLVMTQNPKSTYDTTALCETTHKACFGYQHMTQPVDSMIYILLNNRWAFIRMK